MPSRQVISILILTTALIACGRNKHPKTDAIEDRAATAVLQATHVSTLISDSGITRYRISAEQWFVYDKSDPTYWDFPQGLYLEKFNEVMVVDASIRADKARYWDQTGLWQLDGNVHAMNEEGEQFDTPQLIWDQQSERIYSDSNIVIRRQSSVLEGVGFTSNQTMTEYTILQPTGYFPIEETNHDTITE